MSKLRKITILATCCFIFVAGIALMVLTQKTSTVSTVYAEEPIGVDATFDSIHAREAYSDYLVYIQTNKTDWSDANGIAGNASGIIIDGTVIESDCSYFRFGETSEIAMTMSFDLFPENRTVCVRIPAGTVFGNVKLNSELRFNAFGHKGASTESEERVIYWDNDSGAQDNHQRYLIWLDTKGAVLTSDAALSSATNQILIDGNPVNVEYTYGGGNKEYAALVKYSCFGEGITSCDQITDVHEIVFPKGLAIGNITFKEEFKAYVFKYMVRATVIDTVYSVAVSNAVAAQRASDWLIRMTAVETLSGEPFSVHYGLIDLTTDVGVKTAGTYVCEDGGLALTVDFTAVPADYKGRVTIKANTISSGSSENFVKITDEYSFILADGKAYEDKTYTVTVKNVDTVLATVTYDVLDRDAKLAGLRATIEGLTPPEHYYYSVELPEVLPENDCEYAITVKPVEYDVTFGDAEPVKVAYGEKLVKPENDPVKETTVDKIYTFDGWYVGEVKWDFETDTVAGDTVLVAKFAETTRKYTVKFMDGDAELFREQVEYGVVPEYKGETPTMEKDAQYTYAFKGWTPEVAAVTGDAVYTAVYDKTVNKYTVKFMDGDAELYSEQVEYGVIPEYKSETPTKESDEQRTYAFKGWTPEVVAITGDAVYTAVYDEQARQYTVTVTYVGIEKDVSTIKVAYGEKLDLTLFNESGYTFTVKAGDEEITEVTVTSDVAVIVEYVKSATEEKKSCFSSVSGSAIAFVLMGIAAVCLKKKND